MNFAMLSPRLGFEIELLAPAGRSRRDLAEVIAEQVGGTSRTVFHHDTELSLVEGHPVFHHLTAGFEVIDAVGHPVCRLVDDVTIVDDLDRSSGAVPGWYRILSDEPRILRLIERIVDPDAPPGTVLQPVAELFGVSVTTTPSGRFVVNDSSGASIAMVSPDGGGRERVCELITPPLGQDRLDRLVPLIDAARALGFRVPAEAAVHVHLDADTFRSPRRFAGLVLTFGRDREQLLQRFGTNPRCRRLGPLPPDLVTWCAGLIDGPERPWPAVEAELGRFSLTKYCDLNLTRLRARPPTGDTVEVRIFPGTDDAAHILEMVADLDRSLAGC